MAAVASSMSLLGCDEGCESVCDCDEGVVLGCGMGGMEDDRGDGGLLSSLGFSMAYAPTSLL